MIKGKICKQLAANTVGFILLSVVCFCQQQHMTPAYPQGYFRNPLNIPMNYTANFGELRPNHWHMGFDLRTDQKQNLPVYAAADGYVAHVGVRALSFGRYMIIRHPNGYSTLYAHLNDFFPALERKVREKQTELESWTVELDFPKDEFSVKKGAFIAHSGNSGASQGPHLHFEIIDSKSGRSVNPSLFGFPIPDKLAPVINQLALYDRSTSTYFQSPQLFRTTRTDSGYYLKSGKIRTGNRKLSFALETYDLVNGSSGKNGIYGAILYFDNQPQIQFLFNEMTYQESNYINAHIDRRIKNIGGPYLQHLSRLPGFMGTVYSDIQGNGILELKDTITHTVKIEVFDTDKNKATLIFDIQFSENEKKGPLKAAQAASKKLVPGEVNMLKEKEFEVVMPENCIYDTLPLFYFKHNVFLPGAVSARHQFNDPQYPVHRPFTVRIRPTIVMNNAWKNKMIMLREWQEERSVKKAQEQNGWFVSSFADFGNFQLFIDTIAPQLLPPVKGNDTLDFSSLTKIVFRPVDQFGNKSFRAELFTPSAGTFSGKGKWLMFSNDKARDYIYVFDEQCPYGVHRLTVRVEDLAGNVTEKTWWFKRHPKLPPHTKTVVKKKSPAKK